MDKIERNERQQNAAKEPEEWEENVDEEEEKELRRMAIQLGLCHLAKFKEGTEYGGKGMDGDDKMEVDDPTTSADGNDFDVQNRKVLWSLLRAIRCLHGRHPKLEAQCFREGALYINKLADTQKGMQKEMQLNLRNIFARLLYKQ